MGMGGKAVRASFPQRTEPVVVVVVVAAVGDDGTASYEMNVHGRYARMAVEDVGITCIAGDVHS